MFHRKLNKWRDQAVKEALASWGKGWLTGIDYSTADHTGVILTAESVRDALTRLDRLTQCPVCGQQMAHHRLGGYLCRNVEHNAQRGLITPIDFQFDQMLRAERATWARQAYAQGAKDRLDFWRRRWLDDDYKGGYPCP